MPVEPKKVVFLDKDNNTSQLVDAARKLFKDIFDITKNAIVLATVTAGYNSTKSTILAALVVILQASLFGYIVVLALRFDINIFNNRWLNYMVWLIPYLALGSLMLVGLNQLIPVLVDALKHPS